MTDAYEEVGKEFKEVLDKLKVRIMREIEEITEFDADRFVSLASGIKRLSEEKMISGEELRAIWNRFKEKLREVM